MNTVDMRAKLSRPGASGEEVRLACRSGDLDGHTSGLAPGFAQANLVILPREQALDFLAFCVRNPKPCPLLEVTDAGVYEARSVAPGSDIRTDLPRYRVWRGGVCAEEVTDIKQFWPDGAKGDTADHPDARSDWVAFLLGCSFSFEEALLAAKLPVRHLQQEAGRDAPLPGGQLAVNPRNVPMYRTNIPTAPAGPFSGPLVVSMRPMTPEQALKAAEVTAQFPRVHGRCVFAGDPSLIGISDIGKPDYGDAVTIMPGEVPVFWACGVTPQAALVQAKVPIAITHAPGHMFVASALNKELAGPAELPRVQGSLV